MRVMTFDWENSSFVIRHLPVRELGGLRCFWSLPTRLRHRAIRRASVSGQGGLTLGFVPGQIGQGTGTGVVRWSIGTSVPEERHSRKP